MNTGQAQGQPLRISMNWNTHKRPILALSPMADMTDSAFCRTVRFVMDSNAVHMPVVFREMVSAEAVTRGNSRTLNMTSIHPDERPIIQQLFGSSPEVMAEAVKKIEAEHHPEGFDINMGCPVYKIVNNFNGAALMKEPELAQQIVRAMKAVTTLPISVKIRAGWDDPNQCFAFAKVLEQAGADMITIHGRTKIQGYSGTSDWDLIKQLKQTVTIPLLANGDIHTAPLAVEALNVTGCDGVSIARGALGNPWIFKQINDLLEGKTPEIITLTERIRVIKQHLNFHTEEYGEMGVITFRKHLSWYFRGIDGAKPYKLRLHTTLAVSEVHAILDEMAEKGLENDGLSSRDANHPQASTRTQMSK